MIGIIGTPGHIPAERLTTEERLQLVGQNTGNLVFQLAVALLLPGPKRFLSLAPHTIEDPLKPELIVFPAANNLRIGGIGGALMDYLEQTGSTTIVIGLGVQSALAIAPSEILETISQDPLQIRFLRWLRSLKTKIGVRGNVTRQVLALAGIDSLVVGCPSLAINKSPDLGQRIAEALERMEREGSSTVAKPTSARKPALRAAVTAAATWEVYNRGDPELLRVEQRLFEIASETGGSYIQQSGGAEVIDMSDGKISNFPQHTVGSMSKILGWRGSKQKFVEEYADLARVFFSAESWLASVREHDFSIGTRVHGNMMGIAAGIPSIFVRHDSRTAELVDTMRVPEIGAKDLVAASGLEEVLRSVRFDADAFDETRRDLFQNLGACLNVESGDFFTLT